MRKGTGSSYAKKHVDAIDNALEQRGYVVDQELVTWRSLSKKDALHPDNAPALGEVVTDKGYPSATIDEQFARTWKAYEGRKHIEIRIPPGYKGAYVANISSSGAGEAEYLFPRNTTFRVLGWRDDGIMVVEVVPK